MKEDGGGEVLFIVPKPWQPGVDSVGQNKVNWLAGSCSHESGLCR